LEQTRFSDERFKKVLELAKLSKEWREGAMKIPDNNPNKALRLENCDRIDAFLGEYHMLLRIVNLSRSLTITLRDNILVDGKISPSADIITLADLYGEIEPDLDLLNKIFK